MKDLIITISADTRKVKFNRGFIGFNGENLQGNIVVDFTDKKDFVNGTATFEVEQGGKKYAVAMDKDEANKLYSLPIKSSLLKYACTLKCQVVITQSLTEHGNPVFKSEVFGIPCYEAINAGEEIPDEYPIYNIPFAVDNEADLVSLLTDKNVGKTIYYDNKAYIIEQSPRIRVGDKLTELYFDTSWLPYVYSSFITYKDNHELIKTGEVKSTLIQNGERAEFTTQLGLAARNQDDPVQAELVWRTSKYKTVELEYITDDAVRIVLDGKEVYSGSIDGVDDLESVFEEIVVYRDYEKFWENNGKPVYWLTDKIVLDKPVTVEELNGQEVWGEYISKTPFVTLDYTNADGTIGARLVISAGTGGGAGLENITHSALKALRDNGQLVAGQQYRITDYVATTAQDNTQSAGHAFDIIVTADTPNTLNENARAVLHEGDTYFANCKLSAWEIKYSLDNDTNRFFWASKGEYWIKTDCATSKVYILDQKITIGGQEYYRTTVSFIFASVREPKTNEEVYYYNGETAVTFEEDGDNVEEWGKDETGKGVIYFMKDEYDNECPYDFKNIQFKRWQTDTEIDEESIVYSSWNDTGNDFRWCYTFMAYNADTMEFYGDASIMSHNHYGSDELGRNCLGNIIKPYECEYDTNEESDRPHGKLMLNNIVLYGWNYGEAIDTEEFDYNSNDMPLANTFGYQCHSMTIGHKLYGVAQHNNIGNNCDYILLSGEFNTVENNTNWINASLVYKCWFRRGNVEVQDISDCDFVGQYYKLDKQQYQTNEFIEGELFFTLIRQVGWYEIEWSGYRTLLYRGENGGTSYPIFYKEESGDDCSLYFEVVADGKTYATRENITKGTRGRVPTNERLMFKHRGVYMKLFEE